MLCDLSINELLNHVQDLQSQLTNKISFKNQFKAFINLPNASFYITLKDKAKLPTAMS